MARLSFSKIELVVNSNAETKIEYKSNYFFSCKGQGVTCPSENSDNLASSQPCHSYQEVIAR